LSLPEWSKLQWPQLYLKAQAALQTSLKKLPMEDNTLTYFRPSVSDEDFNVLNMLQVFMLHLHKRSLQHCRH
jgi:hypothetical protein